jgi:hypothetical protein
MKDNMNDLYLTLKAFSKEDRAMLVKNLEAAEQSRSLFMLHAIMHIVGICGGIYLMYFCGF